MPDSGALYRLRFHRRNTQAGGGGRAPAQTHLSFSPPGRVEPQDAVCGSPRPSTACRPCKALSCTAGQGRGCFPPDTAGTQQPCSDSPSPRPHAASDWEQFLACSDSQLCPRVVGDSAQDHPVCLLANRVELWALSQCPQQCSAC